MVRRHALLVLLLSALVASLAAPAPADSRPSGTAHESLRAPLTRERFYFAMVDRFANGNPGNDRGGLAGDRTVTGLDPASKGFYHGGDFAGLRSKLDYIQGLGVSAIWMSPIFKNRPVQGDPSRPETLSAGYHGYWTTDFTQVDPHLGSGDELRELIDAAHARGMKVFFDIITNHTADVVDYEQKRYDYISKAQSPYRDAAARRSTIATSPSRAPFRPSTHGRASPTHPCSTAKPRPESSGPPG